MFWSFSVLQKLVCSTVSKAFLKSTAAIQRHCCNSCARCLDCWNVCNCSEACLVRRLVFVQRWLETVEEKLSEEFVEHRDGAYWWVVGNLVEK